MSGGDDKVIATLDSWGGELLKLPYCPMVGDIGSE
jgi:hypothetical protein